MFMALVTPIPHGPLFLDHGGECCSQLWLEMCPNYSPPCCSRASIIIPKGGGYYVLGLCVISQRREPIVPEGRCSFLGMYEFLVNEGGLFGIGVEAWYSRSS